MINRIILIGFILLKNSFAIDFSLVEKGLKQAKPYSIENEELLIDGTKAFEKRLEMIQKAESSIYYMALYLNESDYAQKFLDAIIKRKKEVPSLDIKILMDETYTYGNMFWGSVSQDVVSAGKQIEAIGGQVAYYQSTGEIDQYYSTMHEKAFIVDAKMAIVGGRNMSTGGFNATYDLDLYFEGDLAFEQYTFFLRKFRETALNKQTVLVDKARVKIQNLLRRNNLSFGNDQFYRTPQIHPKWIKKMLLGRREFDQFFKNKHDGRPYFYRRNGSSRRNIERFKKQALRFFEKNEWLKIREHLDSVIPLYRYAAEELKYMAIDQSYRSFIIHHHPIVKNQHSIRDMLISMLENAETRVTLCSPYFFPGKKVREAIVKATNRGVEVVIINNSPESTDLSKGVPYHRLSYYQFFTEGDPNYLKIMEITDKDSEELDYVHGKIFSADGELLALGSFNIDKKSENTSSEQMILLNDKVHAKKYEDAFFNHYINYFTEYSKSDFERDREELKDGFNSNGLKKKIIGQFL